MDEFDGHVAELRRLYLAKCKGEARSHEDRRILHAAGKELRDRVSQRRRRLAGSFFTGRKLASQLVSLTRIRQTTRTRYFDPTCGAGDLLLCVAGRLPLKKTFKATLRAWGKQLAGVDLYSSFIKACHLRLALLAIERGSKPKFLTARALARLFPDIHVGNAFRCADLYRKADIVLLNPPYTPRRAPQRLEWGTGRITDAALFFDIALRECNAGAKLLAILPDVLRSGSRYSAWRRHVGRLAKVTKIVPSDVFDDRTDIHVFLLRVETRKSLAKNADEEWGTQSSNSTVGTSFNVAVGPVVPFRHDETVGSSRPYLHPRNIVPWESVKKFSERRRFAGTSFKPPFVVVKRTSRPEDSYRAVATIIQGDELVAVENHLLVCIPKSGTLKECRRLVKALKTKRVKNWLDNRIRCRHLTVGAISECPLQRAA